MIPNQSIPYFINIAVLTRAMLSDALAAKLFLLSCHRKDQFSAISLLPAAYRDSPCCETYALFRLRYRSRHSSSSSITFLARSSNAILNFPANSKPL